MVELYRANLIELFKEKSKLINFTLFLLGDIFEYAIKLGYLNDNPTIHARIIERRRVAEPYVLTKKETAALVQCPEYFQDILTVLLETGLSIQELAGLKWEDINPDERKIKSGGRDIFIAPEAQKVFDKLKFSKVSDSKYVFTDSKKRPYFKKELDKELENLKQKNHLSDKVNFAAFRHAFVKNLLNRGVSLVKIYEILGLKDIARVFRYACWVPLKKI